MTLGTVKFLMKGYQILSGTKKSISEVIEWLETIKDGGCETIIFHPGKFDSTSKSTLNK